MNTFLGFVSYISIGYIFAFPIILVSVKLNSEKEFEFKHKSMIMGFINTIALVILNLCFTVLRDSTFMWFFILMWFMLVIPVTILLFLFLNSIFSTNSINTGQIYKKILGFRYRTATLLILSVVLAVSIIFIDTSRNSTIVLKHHSELFNRLHETKDKEMALLEETSQPLYKYADIIKDIGEIKESKADVIFALPWKIGVSVYSETKSKKYWRLEYIRQGNRWRLGSIYEKGYISF